MAQTLEYMVHHRSLLYGHLAEVVVVLIGVQLNLVPLVVLEVEMLRVVIPAEVEVLEI
jgi:hypothetical protein